MSDTSQGEGWWLASDGKWYAPTQQPGWAPPPPAGPPFEGAGPSYQQPPVGYGPPPAGYSYAAPASTNGFAIAALVLGIIWIWGIGSILALIFGYKAKGEIDRSAGRQGGRGMAVAGIVLGWIGVVGTALIFSLAFFAASSTDSFDINSDPANGWCNEDRYWQDPDC